MEWAKPSSQELWRAIEIYLAIAYAGSPPAAVRGRLDALRALTGGDLFDCDVFERDDPRRPTRYRLRLGNRCYPHMKLAVERSPDGKSYLLRADTHDRHCMPPPGSPEQAAFAQLAATNQALAGAIEEAWVREGLPTFKEFLRRDLQGRAVAARGK